MPAAAAAAQGREDSGKEEGAVVSGVNGSAPPAAAAGSKLQSSREGVCYVDRIVIFGVSTSDKTFVGVRPSVTHVHCVRKDPPGVAPAVQRPSPAPLRVLPLAPDVPISLFLSWHERTT